MPRPFFPRWKTRGTFRLTRDLPRTSAAFLRPAAISALLEAFFEEPYLSSETPERTRLRRREPSDDLHCSSTAIYEFAISSKQSPANLFRQRLNSSGTWGEGR